MNSYSWGKYPNKKCKKLNFNDNDSLSKLINSIKNLIAYGNGRSYGDSALNNNIVDMKSRAKVLDFDEKNGVLHVESGILLSEIIERYVPKGWFLRITPGTKFITIGGAIAADIHGKNHHIEGCFSQCIEFIRIMLPNGKIVECSNQKIPELFNATCGGMGLTGFILDAKIKLKKIKSKYINQTIIKVQHLGEMFELFEQYSKSPYSVAWIDSFANGKNIGKGLFIFGDFNNDKNLNYITKRKINIPFYFPNFILNRYTLKIFNWIYYNKNFTKVLKNIVELDSFFYPLDGINNWNRIYGKKGFIQYQFILPKINSLKGINEILNTISLSGRSSFLAVLKLYGKSNTNYLSFPMEGYSLALDFKIEEGLFQFLNKLDKIVLKYSGRIYLAKDARVSTKTFRKGYPLLEKFINFRKKNNMNKKFESFQSKRLKI